MQNFTPQATHLAFFLNEEKPGVWPITLKIIKDENEPKETEVQIRIFVSENYQIIIPLSKKEAAKLGKELI